MIMMQNSIKTLVIVLIFTLATYEVSFAQQKQLRGWSEPLFEDNAAEFDAQPGSFEFCTSFGSSPSLFGWRNDLCWEVEAMITKKLGIESGFYTTWLQQPDKIKQTESTRTAIGLQYTLKNTRSEAWATGIDLLSPGWAPRGQQQTEGWGFKQNIIYARRWLGGVDSQWRLTPKFEVSGKHWQFGGTVQGAFFLAKRLLQPWHRAWRRLRQNAISLCCTPGWNLFRGFFGLVGMVAAYLFQNRKSSRLLEHQPLL